MDSDSASDVPRASRLWKLRRHPIRKLTYCLLVLSLACGIGIAVVIGRTVNRNDRDRMLLGGLAGDGHWSHVLFVTNTSGFHSVPHHLRKQYPCVPKNNGLLEDPAICGYYPAGPGFSRVQTVCECLGSQFFEPECWDRVVKQRNSRKNRFHFRPAFECQMVTIAPTAANEIPFHTFKCECVRERKHVLPFNLTSLPKMHLPTPSGHFKRSQRSYAQDSSVMDRVLRTTWVEDRTDELFPQGGGKRFRQCLDRCVQVFHNVSISSKSSISWPPKNHSVPGLEILNPAAVSARCGNSTEVAISNCLEGVKDENKALLIMCTFFVTMVALALALMHFKKMRSRHKQKKLNQPPPPARVGFFDGGVEEAGVVPGASAAVPNSVNSSETTETARPANWFSKLRHSLNPFATPRIKSITPTPYNSSASPPVMAMSPTHFTTNTALPTPLHPTVSPISSPARRGGSPHPSSTQNYLNFINRNNRNKLTKTPGNRYIPIPIPSNLVTFPGGPSSSAATQVPDPQAPTPAPANPTLPEEHDDEETPSSPPKSGGVTFAPPSLSIKRARSRPLHQEPGIRDFVRPGTSTSIKSIESESANTVINLGSGSGDQDANSLEHVPAGSPSTTVAPVPIPIPIPSATADGAGVTAFVAEKGIEGVAEYEARAGDGEKGKGVRVASGNDFLGSRTNEGGSGEGEQRLRKFSGASGSAGDEA